MVHPESQSYCVGAGTVIDLLEYPPEEQLVSEAWDTVCVRRFCGGNQKCVVCENYYIPTKTNVDNASKGNPSIGEIREKFE